jgi:hypothetical protein
MPASTYRFLVPSFVGGMAQVLDVGARSPFYLYGPGLSPAQRDARALGNDWRMVGGDIFAAMRRVAAEAHHARGARRRGAR